MQRKQRIETIEARKIADEVGGKLEADPHREIKQTRGAAAAGPHSLTYAEDEKFLEQAIQREAGLILMPEDLYSTGCFDGGDIPAVLVEEPRLAYAKAGSLFFDDRYYNPGVSDDAKISDQAELGEEVSIHAGAVISGEVRIAEGSRIAPGCVLAGEVDIGKNCLLHPGVKLLPGTRLGDRVEIQSGAVIGSDGFGYASDEEGHHRIPQQGRVVIEDDVEIGALTAVDRAAEGETRIGAGSKIDNLVQISHNVIIDSAALIAGQSGIAGSTSLGARVTMAGQAGVEDHLDLGDDVIITGKAKVSKDLPESGMYSGIPAQPHREYLTREAMRRKLPRMREKLNELRQEVNELRKEIGTVDD